MWHVSSRSGVATLRTAIHLLLTYWMNGHLRYPEYVPDYFQKFKTKSSVTHDLSIHLTALCPGLPGRAGTRKVNPIWILLKQETVSGSGHASKH